MVAHAGARDHVVGWSRVLKPATVCFGGDEARAVSHRVVMFWRSDVLGHLIADGVWGSVGCGQQLPGGGGPSGAYAGVCGRRGRGWFGSLAVCARHMTAQGAWWVCEPEPTTTGHRGGGLRKPKLVAAGWWWAGGYRRGYVWPPGGVVVGSWQPGQGSCCSRGVGGCWLG